MLKMNGQLGPMPLLDCRDSRSEEKMNLGSCCDARKTAQRVHGSQVDNGLALYGYNLCREITPLTMQRSRI